MTPVPPTPPGGSPRPSPMPPPRPRQDTATDYAEARQQLADTGQPQRPELVEGRTAVNRLGRLEERADEHQRWLAKLEIKLDTNTKASFKGATAGQVAAVMATIGAALALAAQVLGQYGADHPEAKVGVVGVVLGLAAAYNRVRAGQRPPDPPPSHT